VILLAPFAPHISEELYHELGHEASVFTAQWPAYDEKAMEDDEIQIPVQVNGKTKIVVSVDKNISKEDAIAAGKAALGDKLTGSIVKEIYVPGRIINLVVK
jgi:leucyl-tRNA synthetase